MGLAWQAPTRHLLETCGEKSARCLRKSNSKRPIRPRALSTGNGSARCGRGDFAAELGLGSGYDLADRRRTCGMLKLVDLGEELRASRPKEAAAINGPTAARLHPHCRFVLVLLALLLLCLPAFCDFFVVPPEPRASPRFDRPELSPFILPLLISALRPRDRFEEMSAGALRFHGCRALAVAAAPATIAGIGGRSS